MAAVGVHRLTIIDRSPFENIPCLDPDDSEKVTDQTRKLGLVVVRGTQVSLVSPQDGVEEIANPFLVAEEGEE
jgi:hypothetical protein